MPQNPPTMMSQSEKDVDCAQSLGHWDSLFPDVRRVVLSKVPLRDLAHAAETCREFRGAFRSRLGEERERLISVAEAKYGKDVVSGFDKSVQDSICGADTYCCQTEHGEYVIVNPTGEPELVTSQTLVSLWRIGYVAYFYRRGCRGTHVLQSSCRDDDFLLDVMRTGMFSTQIEAHIEWGNCEAQVGILLAICTREHEPVLSRACRPSKSLKAVPVDFWVPETDKVFRGPLGELADTFFHYIL